MKQPWHSTDPFHRWSKFQTDGFKAYVASIRPSERDVSPLPHSWLSSPFQCSMFAAQSRFDEMCRDTNVNWMFRLRQVHGVWE